ncbi:MAG: hypothetical protein J6Y19_01625, partial [Kiritimatiellae bacterium]|nr:hypothetical protein [Kiritimatiellia bacterium]
MERSVPSEPGDEESGEAARRDGSPHRLPDGRETLVELEEFRHAVGFGHFQLFNLSPLHGGAPAVRAMGLPKDWEK